MKNEKKLPLNFFIRDVNTVAVELLGKTFVKKTSGKILSGKIVEVEAYDGRIDEAAHTFKGKTKRNEVMFEEGGLLYVYFTYGVHFCCNVVTGEKNIGNAVLIRGVEPIRGIEEMAINRFNKKSISANEQINLTNGPGKLCKAFNINREQNGINLMADEVFILDAPKIPGNSVITTTRIGIKKSVDLPWRYYIKDNRFVSRK